MSSAPGGSRTEAVLPVCCQRVAVRTDAAERAERVVTPEGAQVAEITALVHVPARLHGARREPRLAGALETAVSVGARAVATNAWLRHAFVLICEKAPVGQW